MSKTPEHWTARAEMVGGGDMRILGEDERGDMCVPDRHRPGWWSKRYNPWNPTHWQYWLRSRITMRIAFLEAMS